MEINSPEWSELLRRIEEMSIQQARLQLELDELKKTLLDAASDVPEEKKEEEPVMESADPEVDQEWKISDVPIFEFQKPDSSNESSHIHSEDHRPKESVSNIEKFIGENLINKVGIAITIIGVAFGAKYAIDHDLLSPAVRVMLGYILGSALLFVAVRLRSKYEGYSAVLTGGAMAVFYLISFAAYSYYGFFSQVFTFMLMVLITAATVYAAIQYNKQVLAQIGFIGAFSVPFLLSDHSGRVLILFSYIAIINIGILVIAFLRSWKWLFYSSFVLTWFVFGLWVFMESRSNQFAIGLFFLTVFYLIFFIAFVLSSIKRNQISSFADIVFIILNAGFCYMLGIPLIQNQDHCHHCMAVFTLCNALAPAVIYGVIQVKKKSDQWLEILLFSLLSIFIVASIMLHFEHQWITIALTAMSAIFFLLGRKRGWNYFEVFAYFIACISLLSLLNDWMISNAYFSAFPEYRSGGVFFNLTFLATALMTGLGFVFWKLPGKQEFNYLNIPVVFTASLRVLIPMLVVFLVYFIFRIEISAYWVEQFHSLRAQFEVLHIESQPGTQFFKRNELMWILNYSFIFFSIISYFNIRRLRHSEFGKLTLGLSVIALLTFLTGGLLALKYLRDVDLSESYNHAVIGPVVLRYLSFVLLGVLVYVQWKQVRQSYIKPIVKVVFDCLMHICIIWISTSELLRILDAHESKDMYKHGLTILWGSYALYLIVLGIWKRMKHLRVMGMIIFGITLIKLMLYDLDHLSTIAKAGLFILIGLFLLFVSYLYLRYKNRIFGD